MSFFIDIINMFYYIIILVLKYKIIFWKGIIWKGKSFGELEQIGSGDALCEIGARYYKNKEYDKALEYIDKAIEKGSLSARVYKVRCYYYGKGLEQNYKEAYVIIHDLVGKSLKMN